MKTTAGIEAQNRYISRKYDRFTVLFKKDSGDLAQIRAYTANQNESMNTFIVRACRERLERLEKDNKKELE